MIEKILNTPNVACPHKDRILRALILYSEKNIDYIDAYNALIMQEEGIEELYSYDNHYDRIEWVTRLEPLERKAKGTGHKAQGIRRKA